MADPPGDVPDVDLRTAVRADDEDVVVSDVGTTDVAPLELSGEVAVELVLLVNRLPAEFPRPSSVLETGDESAVVDSPEDVSRVLKADAVTLGPLTEVAIELTLLKGWLPTSRPAILYADRLLCGVSLVSLE